MPVVHLAFTGQRIENIWAGIKGAIGWTAVGSNLAGLASWRENVLLGSRFQWRANGILPRSLDRLGMTALFPAVRSSILHRQVGGVRGGTTDAGSENP